MMPWGLTALALARVLYLTHSAGFRHDSIIVSRQALQSFESVAVTATEDLSQITAENLRNFDVLFFFTSGELALTDPQKQDLLAFVRDGKGFGGVHSATDTLYGWPEYGDLIGGYFDGHPWAQEATIDVEDPDHPATRHLGSSFRLAEELYQFRNWSRDRVRVLLTLDTRSVDLRAPGVNRSDGDFALAWVKTYGRGRVFYTALGHLDDTWRDRRFQTLIRNALLWLAGESPGEAAPRAARPVLAPGGVVNAATFREGASPGGLVSIFGTGLTSGSSLGAGSLPLPIKLAGTTVTINGAPIPLLYVSPLQINAQIPFELAPGMARLAVAGSAAEPVRIQATAPGIFAILGQPLPGASLSIFATGLGAVRPPVPSGAAAPADPLSRTVAAPLVTVNGALATVRFSGLAPGFAGLYQVDALVSRGGIGDNSGVVLTVP
jgi:hypothetical protein